MDIELIIGVAFLILFFGAVFAAMYDSTQMRKKREHDKKIVFVAGNKIRYYPTGNPFGEYTIVEILEVREKWVKFCTHNFSSQDIEVDSFIYMDKIDTVYDEMLKKGGKLINEHAKDTH